MKRSLLLIFSFSLCLIASGQNSSNYFNSPHLFSDASGVDSSGFVNPKLMQPTIGFGPGVLTFFGDVKDKFSPSLSRMGYHLTVSEYVSRSLMITARAMFGTVGGSERGPRFMNFETSIRSGGLNVTYNFDNFLPKKRRISPFVLTGFEYFEFLSKTDMYDASGNQYHYWSDGSLMSLDETDPNVANAVALTRDYTYETDLRKWNSTLFGKYPERSFAVPVGVGVNLHLAKRWNFKLGTTMHFSFTDYIDGVTPDNKGAGEAKKNKDNFLETYFTVTFDLFNPKPPYVSPVSEKELLALANEDTDGDGVIDFKDSCQGTPAGIPVDAKGCPIDTDGDRFPDYIDKEINSPAGAFVDDKGVAMNDSTIAKNYREWSDTAYAFVSYTDTIVGDVAIAGGGWQKGRDATIVYRRELVVVLGNYKEGVPPSDMSKLLSVPDVRNAAQPDGSSSYVAGSYAKMTDAEKRKAEMIAAGFPNSKIMVLNKDGSLSDPTADALAGIKDNGNSNAAVDMKGVVFRVQVGAFAKKLSTSVFKNAGKVMEIKTDDGLYKYMSESHPNVQDAMKQRNELVGKGYGGAFVVAYKDGKRVPLSTVTSGVVLPKDETPEEPKTPASTMDKSQVFLRVQLGAFVNEPPADIAQKLSKIPGLEKKKKSNGVTQYMAGKFQNYEEAKKFRDEMSSKYGIKDAFMVAFYKDEQMSVQEAAELLK